MLKDAGEEKWTYKVAMVVGLAIIIAEEAHRIILGDVFRVFLHEREHAVPQGRDGLDIFVQAEHKAVLFTTVLHELERVVAYVAEQLNAWLHSPVILEFVH
jgi:hypothetical protein